jgi:hypothetical protein
LKRERSPRQGFAGAGVAGAEEDGAGVVAGAVPGVAGVRFTPPAFGPVLPDFGAGAVAGAVGCVNASSSTDFGARDRAMESDNTKERNRKIPPPHQLALVSRLPAWRVPRSESAELLTPPKLAASPLPLPLCSRMAAMSTRLSIMSRTSRK